MSLQCVERVPELIRVVLIPVRDQLPSTNETLDFPQTKLLSASSTKEKQGCNLRLEGSNAYQQGDWRAATVKHLYLVSQGSTRQENGSRYQGASFFFLSGLDNRS